MMFSFRVSLCSILFVALSFLKATAAGSYAVWATGANFSGQLGDGTTTNRSTPVQVASGLAKSDWESIRAAYEAGRHAFRPTESGWQARNPGQQWATKFDGRGFVAEPRDGGWQWGLELKSYGFGTSQQAVGGTPAVKADGQQK